MGHDNSTPRAIDRRLGPPPKSYLVHAEHFGVVRDPHTQIPAHGSSVSQQFALHLHRLMVTFRAVGARGDQAALAERVGVSTTTISDIVNGKRWPNVTVLLAITTHVLDRATAIEAEASAGRRRSRSGFPIVRKHAPD